MRNLSEKIGTGRRAVVAVTMLTCAVVGRAANTALYYDDAWAEIPHNQVFTNIEQNDALTVEAWIKIDGFPQGWFSIVDKHDGDDGWGWSLQYAAESQTLQFLGGLGPTVHAPQWQPEPGTWHHVAMAYDRSNGYADFYVDGQLLGRESYAEDIQATDSSPMYLGFNPTGAPEWNLGALDELRIWDYARSAEEIAEVYNMPIRAYQPGLVGYWPFDEGAGMTFLDMTPSGNFGVLTHDSPQLPTWVEGAPLIPEPASVLLLLPALFTLRRR